MIIEGLYHPGRDIFFKHSAALSALFSEPARRPVLNLVNNDHQYRLMVCIHLVSCCILNTFRILNVTTPEGYRCIRLISSRIDF
ncbi:MAG: hypothetical protein ACK50J_30935 [Planctomyces sp.]|jgi:hypothetical protein